MDQGQLDDLALNASILITDENNRVLQGVPDPGSYKGQLNSQNIEGLKKRHPFLNEYADSTLASISLDTLLKLESTSIKLKSLEKTRALEEKLAANRDALADTEINVQSGVDNRLTVLHSGRFLPGMGCSVAKMWEWGRKYLGHEGHAAICTYDMKSVGLAGYVTPQGWGALHDPGNSNISLKMFSINNCGRKVASKGDVEDNLLEVVELGEFKVALRVMREALSFVHPWNKSVSAIEGFMFQSNFCTKDLEGLDKQATILTQFVDYILRENSNRWRGLEPFIRIEELKGAWESFFGARPQSMLSKGKAGAGFQRHQPGPGHQPQLAFKQQGGGGAASSSTRVNVHPSLFYEDICVMWNIGKCVKAPGSCYTKNGKPLRHICNFRPDYSRPMPPCGANHAAHFFH